MGVVNASAQHHQISIVIRNDAGVAPFAYIPAAVHLRTHCVGVRLYQRIHIRRRERHPLFCAVPASAPGLFLPDGGIIEHRFSVPELTGAAGEAMDFPLLRAGTHSDRPFLPMGQIRRGGVPPVDIAPRIPVRVILVIQMIRSLILRQSVWVIDPMLPRPKMIPRPKLHTHPSRHMITQKGGKSEGGDAGGEAASLREAPLPQTPSPEEWLGIGLTLPSDLRAHARRSAVSLLVGCGHGG